MEQNHSLWGKIALNTRLWGCGHLAIPKVTSVSSLGGEEIQASLEREKAKQKNMFTPAYTGQLFPTILPLGTQEQPALPTVQLFTLVATEMAGVNQGEEAQAELVALQPSSRRQPCPWSAQGPGEHKPTRHSHGVVWGTQALQHTRAG